MKLNLLRNNKYSSRKKAKYGSFYTKARALVAAQRTFPKMRKRVSNLYRYGIDGLKLASRVQTEIGKRIQNAMRKGPINWRTFKR